jgi:hypothetical protein
MGCSAGAPGLNLAAHSLNSAHPAFSLGSHKQITNYTKYKVCARNSTHIYAGTSMGLGGGNENCLLTVAAEMS